MTALILPPRARAYVNHGRWIAECPYECGSALQLFGREGVMRCTECHSISPIEWPDDADDIWEALEERRLPRTRNWFPEGHHLALKSGQPHGQSAKELRDEQRENEG